MRPEVVHIFNSSRVSGPETLALPALGQLGVPVAVIFLSEERCGVAGRRAIVYAGQLGLQVHEVKVRRRGDLAAVRTLGYLLSALGPKIAHAHDVKASTYLLAAARTSNYAGAIYSTHHGIHGRPDWKTKLYERFYSHGILPRFDRVLAVSSADRAELIGRGLDPEKVQLHLNGADARAVSPAERPALSRRIRAAWGVPVEPLIIGLVGRLSFEKRHDRALAVAWQLERLMPELDWRLVCFGFGKLEAELAAQTARLGLEKRVQWMGYRPRVGDEMAGFDLLLSLSDAEGLPINLIEAGWAATPVLATAVGGVCDLLGQPPAGVLVRPSDDPARIAQQIRLLAEAPARREGLGRALRDRVIQKFSRRAWLDRLRELYAPYLSDARQVREGEQQRA